MPLIELTLSSWRRLPFAVLLSPKVASLSHGSLSFVLAVSFRIRSRKSGSSMSLASSVFANSSRKNVTWTSRVSISQPSGSLRTVICVRSVVTTRESDMTKAHDDRHGEVYGGPRRRVEDRLNSNHLAFLSVVKKRLARTHDVGVIN